ncbi:MAG: hypothetical protein ABI665_09850 [Vicinamibacterales bacterium]
MSAALAVVAFAAPAPWWPTDRDVYERMSREWFIPGCNDFHCFRLFVPVVLGLFPGAALIKWKAYAVLCEAGAAVLMGKWVSKCGASPRAARQVTWLTALGSGSCYTLFDPHTSDPFMHFLAPAVMLLLTGGQVAAATLAASAGVLAKEFAAVPVMVVAAWAAVQGRWRDATKAGIAAAVVLATWAAWQITARTMLGYTTGPTYSADLTTGSYIVFWMLTIGIGLVMASIAMSFGGVWVLWLGGLAMGPRDLRQLTFAALPPLLVFVAIQQPERALWNFAFLAMPAAAVVLGRIPSALGWCIVGIQVLLGLRFGAQLSMAPPARFTLVLAVVLSLAAVWRARAVPAVALGQT